MNKTIKKIILFVLTLSFVFIGFGLEINNVKANELEVIKTHTGSDLTYRGSNEKVYKLSEYNYPTSQLRAVWVTVFAGDISGYNSETQFKQMMNNVLDDMDKMGMNAIVFHVRTHNNALYKSALNPLASWWSGVDFDTFDPLAWLIEECHNRGIEFHAWLNPYRISKNGTNQQYTAGPLPAVNLANDENNLLRVGNDVIFDPGIPEVRQFIVDTCMELIENYDIDAIHFDDYFYIDGADDAHTREKYNTENLSIGDFRRKQVDLFIEALSKEMRDYNEKNNRAVQLGISPSGIYRNGGYQSTPTYDSNGNLISPIYSNTSGFAHYDNYLYSDTLNWINNEWIDYIMPQCYWAIEHTGASFIELTKWWSWAVRHKKVNFYTGLGIYMGADPSTNGSYQYWKYNENEIQLQLLNAGQYQEFDGACFYKYSSLKQTSSSVVNHAVNLISNDYWAKKVPGAVSKYYAPLLDEIAPTNISYDEQTKMIDFHAVENSRGYMIYKVPKGTTLDKNNIDHVYKYTQETSVIVDNFNGYDYYVASVNMANETSEAILVYSALDYNTIVSLIDNLPNVITYEQKDEIINIRNLYNRLPVEQQMKVTNIDKLIDAEATIEKYEKIENDLQIYINGLDLHIKTNRTIPLKSNMTLRYKNSTDINLYNIQTGVKLKNYLAVKEIPLIVTMEEEGIGISKEILVNIGRTAKNQNGLFYRNDPSSMGPDDEGAYTQGASGYIGWSGHTLTIEDNILYIAEGNYHEIINSSNIEKCNWSSVAGVYVNKTGGSIQFKLTNAFDSKSSNSDGYFIISNNKIKTLKDGFDTSASILLEQGETIVIVRYLDTQILGSPMAPVTKLNTNMKAYIDEEKQITDEEKANVIIELIHTIPDSITLNDESLIGNIKNQYDNLDESVKILVTNSQKLFESVEKINELKEELNAKKQQAILELNHYLNLNNYSDAGKKIITDYLTNITNQINASKTIEDVDKLIVLAKNELDQILTIEEELIKYKEEQMKKLEEGVDLSLYSTTNKQIVLSQLEQAKNLINNATTMDEVKQIIENTLNHIDQILTIEEEEQYIQKIRDEYIQKIDDLIASFDNITDEERQELIKDGNSFKEQIHNAKTESDIQYIWTRAEDTIHLYFENVKKAREHAINEINTYLNQLSYTEKEIAYIKTLVLHEEKRIKEMASIEEIKTAPNLFIEQLEILHEELVEFRLQSSKQLDDLIQSWYTDNQKQYLEELITASKNEIILAANKEEVSMIKDNCVLLAGVYIEELTNAICEANDYLNSVNNTSSIFTQLIYQYKQDVSNAKTTEDVELLINGFKKEYIEIAKEDLNNFINNLNYNDKEKIYIHTKKETLFTKIEQSLQLEDIEGEMNKFKKEIEDTHQELLDQIEMMKEKIEKTIVSSEEAKEYLKKILEDIKVAGSKEELEVLMKDFDQIVETLDSKTSNCTCNDSSIVYILISVVFSITLVLFRKKH